MVQSGQTSAEDFENIQISHHQIWLMKVRKKCIRSFREAERVRLTMLVTVQTYQMAHV